MDRKVILVVDPEFGARQGLQHGLQKAGYEVATAGDGAQALELLGRRAWDLILFDISLPGGDGWEVCRRIREASSSPVIILTALAGEENVVRGLRCGADDYLSKPFSFNELLARIEAALRRSTVLRVEPAAMLVFDGGRLAIDQSKGEVYVEGSAVPMTTTEYRLLLCMARNRGRVISQKELLREVWGPEYAEETGYIKVYVRSIRKKIERDPAQPCYLRSRRGLGYYFDGDS